MAVARPGALRRRRCFVVSLLRSCASSSFVTLERLRNAGGQPASAPRSLAIPLELLARQVPQLRCRQMGSRDALLLSAWLGACLAMWVIRVMPSGFFKP